jgi:hypothetical protein
MVGVARQEVMAVSTMLSPEWQSFINIPLAAVQLCDTAKIKELLVAQLPAVDPNNQLSMVSFFPTEPSRISEAES